MDKIIFLILLLFFNNTFSNDEIEIKADQFTYDKNSARIYATGNVEIIDKFFKLNADKVFLNNDSNVISASDNVKIYNKSDGTFLRAKKIVADKTLDNAIIQDKYLYIPTSENLVKKNYIRIAAKKVERRNQYWEKLDNGIFTACDICKKEGSDKFESPLVQVKAKKSFMIKKSRQLSSTIHI